MVVHGRAALTGYINDSVVIASGPIAVDSYIKNSLVISLDSLLEQDDRDVPPRSPATREAKPGPTTKSGATVLVPSGYISEAVVVGLTFCGDLRDSILIGRTVGREPHLRGGEVRAAGPFGACPGR